MLRENSIKLICSTKNFNYSSANFLQLPYLTLTFLLLQQIAENYIYFLSSNFSVIFFTNDNGYADNWLALYFYTLLPICDVVNTKRSEKSLQPYRFLWIISYREGRKIRMEKDLINYVIISYTNTLSSTKNMRAKNNIVENYQELTN